MNKRIRTLVIAGVAVVVLVGALLVLLDPFGWFGTASNDGEESSTTATTTTTIPLIEKTEEDSVTPVSSVEITTPEEQFVIRPDADGTFAVEGYADLPVYTTRVDTLLSAVADIYATRKITDAPANAADFGLEEPLAAVTVTYTDGSTYAFEIGNEEPNQSGYYFREAGQSAIYLVSTTFAETMTRPSLEYIGLTLITEPAVQEDDETGEAQLMKMELSGSVRPQPILLRYAEAADSSEFTSMSQYVITAPYLRAADSDIREWSTALNTLSATGVAAAHPTAEQLQEFGLSDPYSVAVMTFAVYAETEDTVTTYNEQTLMLRLGGKDEDGSYYAMLDGVDVVYLVSPSAVPWAEMTYDDLVSSLLFTKNIQQVSAISVTADGVTTRFELAHHEDAESTDESLTVTANGTTYPTADFRSLYQVLMQVERFAGADGATAAGDPSVVIRIDPTADGGSAIEAKFYSQTANRYLCVREDGDTYLVSASDVENAVQQLQNYLSGQTVVT